MNKVFSEMIPLNTPPFAVIKQARQAMAQLNDATNRQQLALSDLRQTRYTNDLNQAPHDIAVHKLSADWQKQTAIQDLQRALAQLRQWRTNR